MVARGAGKADWRQAVLDALLNLNTSTEVADS
jgi:hypothetical protein